MTFLFLLRPSSSSLFAHVVRGVVVPTRGAGIFKMPWFDGEDNNGRKKTRTSDVGIFASIRRNENTHVAVSLQHVGRFDAPTLGRFLYSSLEVGRVLQVTKPPEKNCVETKDAVARRPQKESSNSLLG
jgi:hypothetical protein